MAARYPRSRTREREIPQEDAMMVIRAIPMPSIHAKNRGSEWQPSNTAVTNPRVRRGDHILPPEAQVDDTVRNEVPREKTPRRRQASAHRSPIPAKRPRMPSVVPLDTPERDPVPARNGRRKTSRPPSGRTPAPVDEPPEAFARAPSRPRSRTRARLVPRTEKPPVETIFTFNPGMYNDDDFCGIPPNFGIGDDCEEGNFNAIDVLCVAVREMEES